MKKYLSLSCLFILSFFFTNRAAAQPGNYTCIWHTTGNPGAELGSQLVSVGDQNNDGFDDILVSSYNEETVYLYFGGDPMDTIPDMSFHVNGVVLPKECRDLNGDGIIDFTITGGDTILMVEVVYLFFGGPSLDNQPDMMFTKNDTISWPGGYYGKYISMGDINGDGWYDLAVGADLYTPADYGSGKIYVYYGGPDMDNVEDFSITGFYNNLPFLGNHLSCSGDVNDDGYDDILTFGRFVSQLDGIILFFGGNPPDSSFDWGIYSVGTFFYGNQTIIPDINGDSCDEFVYGNSSGNCILYYGGDTISIMLDVILNGYGDNIDNCANAGDVNNDGWGDFISSSGDGYTNYINVFFLGPNMGSNKNQNLLLEQSGYYPFSPAAGYAGDVNGDGVDDFMFSLTQSYYTEPGEVFIYSDTSLSFINPLITFELPYFELQQNYPNPFNGETLIPFVISIPGEVSLSVYNNLGRQVCSLFEGFAVNGEHRMALSANNLSSGVYFIELKNENEIQVKTIQIIK